MKFTIHIGEIAMIASMYFWPTLVGFSGVMKFDFWYLITMIAIAIFIGIMIGKGEVR